MGKVTRRRVSPDTIYGSMLLSRFINAVMKQGKKSLAERVVYSALDAVKNRLNRNPLDVFQDAMNNIKPIVEIKSRRIGGATYQIPISVEDRRSESLAFRWLLESARKKKGRSMAERLASEIADAYNKTGAAMERREATHRMAEANKAFAHFA